MKAVVLAAAVIGIASFAHASECKSVYSKGYTFNNSGDVWVNDTGATISPAGDGFDVNGRHLVSDVDAHGLSFTLVTGTIGNPGASYRVNVDHKASKFVSPELAKLTGGSATFVRKCK